MIGWVLLSRQAVARAAKALEEGNLGVRDEVGFLSLHQAIADRLFPGTSVLQTRARYAVLVPWVMCKVAEAGQHDAERRLRTYEGLLAGQLVRGQDERRDAAGAIGARVWRRFRRAPSQPPSSSYWNALARWGILSPRPDGTTPSRLQVLKQLAGAARRRPAGEDDPHPDEAASSPFVRLPECPPGLGRLDVSLDLAPTREEKAFLRRQIIGVLREDGAPSYLARLVAARAGSEADSPWSDGIAGHADADDRAILVLARGASALAAIGRAVYAALAEAAHGSDYGNARSTMHAEWLLETRARFRQAALALSIDELADRFPRLPADLLHLMRRTQGWLRGGHDDPASLRDIYAAAERARKGERARLPTTLGARQRRAEWKPDEHPLAEPLNFRWPNVRQLLSDLR